MKKSIIAALLLSVSFAFQSCDYANSNVKTLITDDCGVTWKVIPAGQSIPKRIGPCQYKTTLPDYPMQGESKFKGTFKDKVLANVEVSYDYVIVDPIAFISEAKYLGKANSSSEDASNSAKAFETAENSVIDKRIKEVARELLPSEDIVDFSQSDFEDKLLAEVNKMLKPLGVELNFLSFVPTPSEQTSQAIDAATAWKIYQSKEMGEVGKAIMSSKAGASRVVVNQNTKENNEE